MNKMYKRKSRKGKRKPKRKPKKGKKKSRKGKKKSKRKPKKGKKKSRKGKKKSKKKSRKGKKKSKRKSRKGKKKSKRKSRKGKKKSKKGKKVGKKKSRKRKSKKGKKKSFPKTKKPSKNEPKQNLKSSLEKILRSVHPQRSLGKDTVTWLEKVTRKMTVLFTSEITRKEDAEKVLKNLLTKELSKQAIKEIKKPIRSFGITPETIIKMRKTRYEIAQIVAIIVEYLLTEILELGGDNTRNEGRKMVTLSDIKRAIEYDKELTTLMEQLRIKI